MTEEKDKYSNRRKMAWLSFAAIFFVGVAVISFGLSTDERAQRVETLDVFLGTVFGVWIAILLAYFGATTVTDYKEISNDPK